MSLRRISELPSLETFEKQYGSANLSDCIFEVSFTPDNGTTYNSLYLTGKKMEDIIIEHITESTISSLTICGDVDISGGTCRLDNSILELINGSSIIAWPNTKDGVTTKCYLCFNDIRISSNNDINITSDKKLDLYGNPVFINGNLSVYRNTTETKKVVNLTNTGNNIMVQRTPINQLGDHPNRAVTCGMLKETLDYFQSIIQRYDRGSGVPIKAGLYVGISINGSGTVSGEGLYEEGADVQLTATPYDSASFIEWQKIEQGGEATTSRDNPLNFKMPNKPVDLTAYFTGSQQEINITKVTVASDRTVKFTTVPKNVTITPSGYKATKPSSTQPFELSADGYATKNVTYKFTYSTSEKFMGTEKQRWGEETGYWVCKRGLDKDRATYTIRNLKETGTQYGGSRSYDKWLVSSGWSALSVPGGL